MILQLPSPPSTNRLWRTTRTGRMYQAPEVSKWKSNAAWTATMAGVSVTDAPVAVSIVLQPSLTKRGKEMRRRIDLDNAIKAVLDALNGIAYVDDRQVVDIRASLGEPVQGGGLTVEVTPHG